MEILSFISWLAGFIVLILSTVIEIPEYSTIVMLLWAIPSGFGAGMALTNRFR